MAAHVAYECDLGDGLGEWKFANYDEALVLKTTVFSGERVLRLERNSSRRSTAFSLRSPTFAIPSGDRSYALEIRFSGTNTWWFSNGGIEYGSYIRWFDDAGEEVPGLRTFGFDCRSDRMSTTSICGNIPSGATRAYVSIGADSAPQVTVGQPVSISSVCFRTYPAVNGEGSRVRLRDDGVALVDDKPFFPIGIYRVCKTKENNHDYRTAFKEMRAAGFNAAHTYQTWQSKSYGEFLDAADEAGIKLLVPVGPENGNFGFNERYVLEARNRKSLLAWYLADDTALHIPPKDVLWRDMCCRRLDPEHPTLQADCVGGECGHRFGQYINCADIVAPEVYPVLNATPLVREMRDALDAGKIVRNTMVSEGARGKASWPIVQYFDGWACWNRYPTFPELRFMTYAQIVCGARGIFFYAYTGSGWKREGRIARGARDIPEKWADLCRVAGELSKLEPVLVSPDSKEQPKVKDPVRVLLKDYEDGYLFAVNVATNAVRMTIPLKGVSAAKSTDGAEFDVRNGLVDELGPRAVRIYRLRKSSTPKAPLISMRLRANDTDSLDIWRRNFRAVAEHPGCCDEIWFSTGCGAPTLDWHRSRAAVIAEAMKDVRSRGIVASLQFQATLGHGDASYTPEMFSHKSWTGWTGWSGIETKACNCPRQETFIAYLREVAKIYASLGFASLWIDDDLRITNHQPSDSYGRHAGCWCETCLKAFNEEMRAEWTRETLSKAVETNDVLHARWREFSIRALCPVARAIAETFNELSPKTMLALQHASDENSVDQVRTLLNVLHDVTGRPVGFRPGGGAYYDDDPNCVVEKSLQSGWFRMRIGDPDFVKIWTPEIESWPRTYYSRSSQGVLIEGFSALMYGMNGVSCFVSNGAKEEPALYGRTLWKSIAGAAPVLHGYARVIEGCQAVGFSVPGVPQIGIRRIALPVLAGPGRCVGELTQAESGMNVNAMTSSDVQELRESLDRRGGALPAIVRSPFSGLMQVHVDSRGDLRCVALANLRITDQGPVRIGLRRIPAAWKRIMWYEMNHAPVDLAVDGAGSERSVTVPMVSAWNGGYLTGETGK